MLTLQNISYTHSNKDLLFSEINLTVNNHEKTALIGNNGVGKSTLLKIIAGELQPSNGQINVEVQPYYVPQIFGQFNHLTIAQALRIEDKLNALKEILNGNTSEENFSLLNDDWTIEDRCNEALNHWQLNNLNLTQKVEALSGGQKTKVFLAGISIHQPELILMDEPSNHLDIKSRQLLYDFVRTTKSTLIIVSHDRFFLDRTVNHLFVFKGDGIIKDFPGDYSTYRHCVEAERLENRAAAESGCQEKSSQRNKPRLTTAKPKLTFKEKKEKEELETLLPRLEAEKSELEIKMSGGEMTTAELLEASGRISMLIEELDEKELRLLELMEKDSGN